MVALGHAIGVNGMDALAITKLDVLGGMGRVKVAVAYEHGGRRLTGFPADIRVLSEVVPVYNEMDGWEKLEPKKWMDIARKGYGALPKAARQYLKYISGQAGIPIELVSVGAAREATLDLRRPRKAAKN